jgi:mycothione reductase
MERSFHVPLEDESMKTYDLVVVGSGAGLIVLERALQAGLSCALVEGDRLGGTCLTRGCIPSKVLTVPADVIREAERAARIGVKISRAEAEWETVGRRMWLKIDESDDIGRALAAFPNAVVYSGTGEFTGQKRMRVRLKDGSGFSEEFKADRFVLATGARSMIPPVEGLEETGYVTTETFFGDKFPARPWKSLVIVGGGLIAAELSHVFSAFGTRVTILEMESRLLPGEEPEVSEFAAKVFRTWMDIRLGTRAAAARTADSGAKRVTCVEVATGVSADVEAEEILVAAGRRSNADLLHPERTGLDLTAKGWIAANAFLETSCPGIWAIGDALGGFQFRHKANSDAEVCAHNLFESHHAKVAVDNSLVPWAVYTHPQVGHVGLTEKQALEAGHEVMVATQHYSDIARGFAMGYEPGDVDDGFVKLVADRSMKLLGAHVVGPHAATLVQPFVYLMNSGYSCPPPKRTKTAGPLTKDSMACPEAGSVMPIFRSMVIHPSLNELTAWAVNMLEPVEMRKIDPDKIGS